MGTEVETNRSEPQIAEVGKDFSSRLMNCPSVPATEEDPTTWDFQC